jgi:hypothetical protein
MGKDTHPKSEDCGRRLGLSGVNMADWHETLEGVGNCGLDCGRTWLSLTAAEVEQT